MTPEEYKAEIEHITQSTDERIATALAEVREHYDGQLTALESRFTENIQGVNNALQSVTNDLKNISNTPIQSIASEPKSEDEEVIINFDDLFTERG